MNFFEPADIIIYIQGRGIVLKEKSLVAFDNISGKIMGFGKEAEDIAKNMTNNIKIISPMKQGTIADYITAAKFFHYLLNKAWGKKSFLVKPSLVVCASKELTMVDKKALEDVLYQTGAREVFITDVPFKQLLDEIPQYPQKWKKYKIFIDIAKDKPENYITEQLLALLDYAKEKEISVEKITELFQNITSKHIS